MTESTTNPQSGLWKPHQLQRLHYGPDSVKNHLLECLPTPSSKAFIITGSSLANKTPLIKQVEQLLGPDRHAGTFSQIGQHAPVAQLDEATEAVGKDEHIDTLISVGGGSPIDSAKAISYRQHERTGKYLFHIAVPTTLSAGECTMIAGYTNPEGKKVSVVSPRIAPEVVLYDPLFARETPPNLYLSTGLRALDHAVELQYHPTASEVPARQMGLYAASALFKHLPKYKADPKDIDTITALQLAAFASLGFLGTNLKGGLGLSHTLGYALGSPYGIPHGTTSCLTLGHVVKLKAESDSWAAGQLARMAGAVGVVKGDGGGDDVKAATQLGDAILKLVEELGLKTTLSDWKVGQDQAQVVARTATGGQTEGELYEKVLKLVEGLY